MTIADTLGLSDSQERVIVRVLQGVLFGFLVFGLTTGQLSMTITSGIALGVTLFPAILRREYGYAMDAGLVLWITIAMILHTAGSLSLYSQYQWYDEVTHTVSATIVAGIGYASFRALELHSDAIDVPSEFRTIFIVVFVLAMGIFWEILEFALGGLITVYGVDDIVTDMIFNTVGALIVAIWGTGYVGSLVGFFRERLRSTES
ncbi:hypothetical protein [Haladaptatus cibarius]|uniref:hypothetical protein n=1 Tax=Haladaptatus cibarius TaxID=453847 RepID=UPI0006785646|nr:hypothetical protein [Haladaptatus cibarius]